MALAAKIHHATSTFAALTLYWLTITGCLFTVFEHWVEWEGKPNFMKWHTGSAINAEIGTWFPIVTGSVAVVQIATGMVLNNLRAPQISLSKPNTWRQLHRFVTVIAGPLWIIVAVTGLVYRTSRRIFEMPKDQVGWVLEWHNLQPLGLQSVFPFVFGVAVFAAGITGYQIKYSAEQAKAKLAKKAN